MKPITKYKGAIKLSAIGDALGWITEFEKSSDSLNKKYGADYISRFYDWKKQVGGRFNGYIDYIAKGSYSDDTQLMLAVARSIMEDGRYDNEYFSKIELPNWLHYARGAGRTIKFAAKKIQRKSAKWNNNFFTFKVGNKTIDYRECGANGAAMRILPIALAKFSKLDEMKKEIFANSIVTHGHPRAIIGAMLYGYTINILLTKNPEDFAAIDFIVELGTNIRQKLSIPFVDEPEFKIWENNWNRNNQQSFTEQFKVVLEEIYNSIGDVYRGLRDNQEDVDVLTKLGCYNPETKGSGTSTVSAGIFLCCKYHNDPIKAIEQATNFLGTDTDSIAAFAGGLIGALHGTAIIPDRFKSVQDYNYLDDVAISLYEISFGEITKNGTKKSSNFRTINEIESDNFKLGEKVSFEPLGDGEIVNIYREDTLTRGKYNLIIDVKFNLGQTCRFAKILSKE